MSRLPFGKPTLSLCCGWETARFWTIDGQPSCDQFQIKINREFGDLRVGFALNRGVEKVSDQSCEDPETPQAGEVSMTDTAAARSYGHAGYPKRLVISSPEMV